MPDAKPRRAGFNPPKKDQGRYTIDELALLKKLLSDSRLSFWIKAAGLGAIFEIGHILWQALRYLKGF
jgi:hypothetical protein